MKRMVAKKIRSLAFAVAVLGAVAALPALAQPPAKSAPPPAPAPSPELIQLSFFAGEWSCKGKVESSPFGPAHATQATVHIRKELGGFWYVGHYAETKTAQNPHPMIFDFFEGYAAGAKAYVLDGFDAFGGHSHQTSPGWQQGKLVYVGENTGDGPPTPARDTFTKQGDAVLEHAGEMQLEGKWALIDQETCTRTKK